MRRLVFMLTISILILSCRSNENKEKETVKKGNPLPEKKLTNDTAVSKAAALKDDLPDFISAFVNVRRSYIYTSPDPQSKSKEFLLKDQLVLAELPKGAGKFVYVHYTSSTGEDKTGWLLFSDLKQILFTPPAVVKDSE